jgi:uncharacterized protein
MRNYFNNILKRIVFAVFFIFSSHSHAGSFEDFFAAVKQDDARTIQALIARGFDVNTRNENGQGALYLAFKEESYKAVDALLAAPKLDVELRSPQDESPLMMAALKGRLQTAKTLIAKGADVNKPGWAPLHYAATGGHVALMKLLLEEHAFIDAQSPNKSTPLMMAAFYGSEEAVKLLLEEGADVMMKNDQGMSAVDFAQRANRPAAFELIAAAVRAKGVKKGF